MSHRSPFKSHFLNNLVLCTESECIFLIFIIELRTKVFSVDKCSPDTVMMRSINKVNINIKKYIF